MWEENTFWDDMDIEDSNPMKHYIIINYYGEMRIQKYKKKCTNGTTN